MRLCIELRSGGDLGDEPPCPGAFKLPPRDDGGRDPFWYLDVQTLEDFVAFAHSVGGCVILVTPPPEEDAAPSVQIWDTPDDLNASVDALDD